MDTIADKIRDWARRELLSASVVTRNTEVHNHLLQALERLSGEDWAQATVQPAKAATDRRTTAAV